jgi:hypothetical protein
VFSFISVSVLAADTLLKQIQLWCGGVVSVPFAVLYAQKYLGELMFRYHVGKLRASLTGVRLRNVISSHDQFVDEFRLMSLS